MVYWPFPRQSHSFSALLPLLTVHPRGKMLVPYYTAQCATGFKSKPIHNLNLNLNRLPNSSLIDGQILNLPVENQIGIEISHCMFQLIVFNEFECRIYYPNQSTSLKLCEDFLELVDLLHCIKTFVEHFPKTVALSSQLGASLACSGVDDVTVTVSIFSQWCR